MSAGGSGPCMCRSRPLSSQLVRNPSFISTSVTLQRHAFARAKNKLCIGKEQQYKNGGRRVEFVHLSPQTSFSLNHFLLEPLLHHKTKTGSVLPHTFWTPYFRRVCCSVTPSQWLPRTATSTPSPRPSPCLGLPCLELTSCGGTAYTVR